MMGKRHIAGFEIDEMQRPPRIRLMFQERGTEIFGKPFALIPRVLPLNPAPLGMRALLPQFIWIQIAIGSFAGTDQVR